MFIKELKDSFINDTCETLVFFFFFFLIVKLPKRRPFGRLYVYNNVTRKKGVKNYFFCSFFFKEYLFVHLRA
jgi:hypothetical protein